ncbi:hypothetical protein GCM10010243_46320 [Streptomyces matensis]|nr:hypothetical protein GCM10010243_46320 [Streptomyces matensis]
MEHSAWRPGGGGLFHGSSRCQRGLGVCQAQQGPVMMRWDSASLPETPDQVVALAATGHWGRVVELEVEGQLAVEHLPYVANIRMPGEQDVQEADQRRLEIPLVLTVRQPSVAGEEAAV